MAEICFGDRDADAHVYIVSGYFDLVGAGVADREGALFVLPDKLREVMLFDDVACLTVDDGDDEVGVRHRIRLGDGD